MLTKFEELPLVMRNDFVRSYHEILSAKAGTLRAKRVVDVLIASVLIVISSPFLLIFSVLIKLTSAGNVFFLQERIGKDNKPFFIFKFRTMVQDADKKGVQLTTGNDARITTFGKFMRKINMDEMPQLFNVIKGDMSIIGTRPEVARYVECYTPEMYATLLIAPGMLSMASVLYKGENQLLDGAVDPVAVYVNEILPDKMKYNLEYLKNITVLGDLKLIGKSIAAAF